MPLRRLHALLERVRFAVGSCVVVRHGFRAGLLLVPVGRRLARGGLVQPELRARPSHRQLRRPQALLGPPPRRGDQLPHRRAAPAEPLGGRDECLQQARQPVDGRRRPRCGGRTRRFPCTFPAAIPCPLGARALYLGASMYRIHGTDAPWTIGQAVSKGCIRMYNEDVLDLYPRVPVGARVTVTWQRANSANGRSSRRFARAVETAPSGLKKYPRPGWPGRGR